MEVCYFKISLRWEVIMTQAVARRHRIVPRLRNIMIRIHLAGLLGILYLWFVDSSLLYPAIGYYFLCHVAITVGAHRYFTHQAFELNKYVAYGLAIMFSAASQNDLYWWVGKHRQHHKFEDQQGEDSHSPKDGFWHAHMLWTLKHGAISIPKDIRRRLDSRTDLAHQVIRWHRKHHKEWERIMTIVVPALLGLAFGQASDLILFDVTIPGFLFDIAAGVLVIGYTRLVFQYHGTWIVNSVGHIGFGKRHNTDATNIGYGPLSLIFAIITVGESYHANHHTVHRHWKLGREFGQFDIGALVIRLLWTVRLAKNLKGA